MITLAFITDAWGFKFGGINAFNTEFCEGLGSFLKAKNLTEEFLVICIVNEATSQEISDAAKKNVFVVSLGQKGIIGKGDPESVTQAAQKIRTVLDSKANEVDFWIGHDIITGALAVKLAGQMTTQKSALINHMSYIDYMAYKSGVGQKALEKFRQQQDFFTKGDSLFAVGPLLRDRLIDMVRTRVKKPVSMIVPGLADVEPLTDSKACIGVTFGRLDPENDRVKQSRLAVAAFALAVGEAHREAQYPRSLLDGRIQVVGITEAGGEEEQALIQLAQQKAGRMIPIIPLPYEEDRQALFNILRSSSIAMMLSWHDGFGLTGWEAISSEVPLILGKGTGLYRLLDEYLAGAGLGCVKGIDIRGHSAEEENSNFTEADEKDVKEAIFTLAVDQEEAKRNAKILKKLLLIKNCTWEHAGWTFLGGLSQEIKEAISGAEPKTLESLRDSNNLLDW